MIRRLRLLWHRIRYGLVHDDEVRRVSVVDEITDEVMRLVAMEVRPFYWAAESGQPTTVSTPYGEVLVVKLSSVVPAPPSEESQPPLDTST